MTLTKRPTLILEYSESDYEYDDHLDMYHTVKSPSYAILSKEFKYGAYQAVMSGKVLDFKLDDSGSSFDP